MCVCVFPPFLATNELAGETIKRARVLFGTGVAKEVEQFVQ